ncbi:MAG: hypothetical protein IJK01_09365 [Clostridia bacterium]|nr:hypothetical protein [Clostridia bacterium]
MKKQVLAILSVLTAVCMLACTAGASSSSSSNEIVASVSEMAEAETAETVAESESADSSDESDFPGTPPDGMGEPPSGAPEGTPPDGFGGGMGEPPSGGFGGNTAPGGSTSSFDYSAATEITSADTQENQTYASTTADESALMISTTDAVTITNPTVTKTGDSDGGDNCNFYGLNAAVLAKDGANVTITGGTISSSASGANGVFSYGGNGGSNGAAGDGTTVTITDTVITTAGSGSGGIMTTGGGVTYANNLTVTTSGQSSAAIRTDRGGGWVYVDGGTYTTNGLGSPAIYSTAEIHVSNATLVSNLSEGVCIEGKNSIELTDCDLTANNTKCNGNATFYDTIMIYQSMSGDADSGTSAFTMTNGALTSKNGHIFHVTNTNAIITLTGVTLVNEDGENILLSVCADGWSGASNIATLNAIRQVLSGTILVGSDSELSLVLVDGSTFTGTISGNISNASGKSVSTEVGTVNVALDSTSTWTLTADTYITSFDGDASSIISNGYTLYVNGVALTGTK